MSFIFSIIHKLRSWSALLQFPFLNESNPKRVPSSGLLPIIIEIKEHQKIHKLTLSKKAISSLFYDNLNHLLCYATTALQNLETENKKISKKNKKTWQLFILCAISQTVRAFGESLLLYLEYNFVYPIKKLAWNHLILNARNKNNKRLGLEYGWMSEWNEWASRRSDCRKVWAERKKQEQEPRRNFLIAAG